MFGEPITVHRLGEPTGARDDQGNPVLGPATTFTIDGVAVAPTSSDEMAEEFGPRGVNGYTLYLPYGSDLRTTDTVTVRGESGWQVEGEARVVAWQNPYSGNRPGSVAVVRRAF